MPASKSTIACTHFVGVSTGGRAKKDGGFDGAGASDINYHL